MLYKTAKTAQRIALMAWVTRQAKSAGRGLRVNGWSSVSRLTTLGDNVHFNGLTVAGSGAVTIGNSFHSGPGCSRCPWLRMAQPRARGGAELRRLSATVGNRRGRANGPGVA